MGREHYPPLTMDVVREDPSSPSPWTRSTECSEEFDGQVFWLPTRPYAFPLRTDWCRTVAVVRGRAGVTAAGPRLIRTGFPWHPSNAKLYGQDKPRSRGCQIKNRGAGKG